MARTIVISGHGRGISDAVARRFGREGFNVALVARSAERLSEAAAALERVGIRAVAFPCDVSDPKQVESMLAKVRASLGDITVLHWNAAAHAAGDLTTAPGSELNAVLDVTVHGLLAGVTATLHDLETNRGAVLVTGGGLSKYDSFMDAVAVQWNAMGLAIGKAAQHKLVGLLHQKLAPRGIFVGEVTVLGIVKGTRADTGQATIDAATVADAFWNLLERRSEAFAEVLP
jgi:NADP-dependent 3-hydroxy acid dehydrogenase YdfG